MVAFDTFSCGATRTSTTFVAAAMCAVLAGGYAGCSIDASGGGTVASASATGSGGAGGHGAQGGGGAATSSSASTGGSVKHCRLAPCSSDTDCPPLGTKCFAPDGGTGECIGACLNNECDAARCYVQEGAMPILCAPLACTLNSDCGGLGICAMGECICLQDNDCMAPASLGYHCQ